MAAGREAGLVDVQPVGAVTVGLAGDQLAELGAMADSAARVRIFSDDGHCVADPRLMRRALEYVKAFDGVIAQHAEEPRLTEGAQMHEGRSRPGSACPAGPRWPKRRSSPGTCCWPSTSGPGCTSATSPPPAAWRSCAGPRRGGGRAVTAEVTPHHLLLTDERARSYDPVFKVNPPLRTAEDVAALRAALVEG